MVQAHNRKVKEREREKSARIESERRTRCRETQKKIIRHYVSEHASLL